MREVILWGLLILCCIPGPLALLCILFDGPSEDDR